MFAKINGAAVQGIDAIPVTIEVTIGNGFGFCLVGLPDTAVKESYPRIKAALKLSGMDFPRRRVVVNMSPADIKKEGAAYDLPIAVGILAADEKISAERLNRFMLMGELSLDGSLQPIKGVLPMAIKAREDGLEGIIVPKANVMEAAVVNRLKVYGADNLTEVIGFFNNSPRTDINESRVFKVPLARNVTQRAVDLTLNGFNTRALTHDLNPLKYFLPRQWYLLRAIFVFCVHIDTQRSSDN